MFFLFFFFFSFSFYFLFPLNRRHLRQPPLFSTLAGSRSPPSGAATHPPTLTSPLSSFLPSCCFSLASAAVRCAALCGDAPCLSGEPTPDLVIARRSRRIASPPVGRGHRNGPKKIEGGGSGEVGGRMRGQKGAG